MSEESSDNEVKVTYETLFEILRLEKSREELQKVKDSFFSDVLSYLSEKTQILKKEDGEGNLFAEQERLKVEKQLYNIKKILKKLYERREKKIVNLALDTSRTNSKMIDTSALLHEEKKMFDSVLDVFNTYRKGILYNMLELKQLNIEEHKAQTQTQETKSDSDVSETEEGTTMIRFLHPVPKFVGKDLEIYGPFEEDDVANLPSEIVQVLTDKQRAEIISPGEA